MDPLVCLIRRFVVEFMNGSNPSICHEIMDDGYQLRVGDQLISGRDAHYIPAVRHQLDQFPGMGMTVHRLISTTDQIAVHFSEHGASGGPGGPVAAWQGIALYRWNGSRLTGCAAEEDYFARRRQLKSGIADMIPPPAPAPWDASPEVADADREQVVRQWLATGMPSAGDRVVFDDGAPEIEFVDVEVAVNELFSAGSAVAFHSRHLGQYRHGLPDAAATPSRVSMSSAGIVVVEDGAIASGHVIRDRAGLVRSLVAAASGKLSL